MNVLRLSLLYATLGLIPVAALGQSTFELSNRRPAAGIDAPVFDADGVPLAGAGYLAELYGGLTPFQLAPAAASEDQPSVRAIVKFSIQGYIISRGVAIFGVASASPAWLQLRAWDARLGATYEEAVALGIGGYGESPIFNASGGGQLGGAPQTPGLLYGLQSFSLRPMVAVLFSNLRLKANQVIVEWHPGFPRYQLQQSSGLGRVWENLGEPTTATAYTNQIGPGAKFYRVIGLLD